MEIEPHVKTLKLSEIEEIAWLKLRDKTDTLHQLGLSIGPCAPPPHPTSDTNLETLMLQLSVGQLAPVRTLRYPLELHHYGPPYGLIFGYRRYLAAKQAKLDTIQAQVIHLTAQEYEDAAVRFLLLLMAFAENTHREPLSNIDYYRALQRLKDKYEALCPAASKQLKHLTQTRTNRGQFTSMTQKRPPNFTKLAQTVTGKSERRIREDIQLADLLTRGILATRYEQPVGKKALLAFDRLPEEKQAATLEQLQSQHLPLSVKNIARATDSSRRTTHKPGTPESCPQRETPVLELPDLDAVQAVTKLCLHLRNNFHWTPATVAQALPLFTDLALASQALTDHLRRHTSSSQNRDTAKASTTATNGH